MQLHLQRCALNQYSYFSGVSRPIKTILFALLGVEKVVRKGARLFHQCRNSHHHIICQAANHAIIRKQTVHRAFQPGLPCFADRNETRAAKLPGAIRLPSMHGGAYGVGEFRRCVEAYRNSAALHSAAISGLRRSRRAAFLCHHSSDLRGRVQQHHPGRASPWQFPVLPFLSRRRPGSDQPAPTSCRSTAPRRYQPGSDSEPYHGRSRVG